jgi:hypothetical protein
MRGTATRPVVVISMAVARVFDNGITLVLDSATGYAQPPSALTVARSTLASASAAAGVHLFGQCGNPADVTTCRYYGTGGVSTRLTAIAKATTFSESKKVTDAAGNAYAISLAGASRPASATGSAVYNGYAWALGRNAYGRILRFDHRESLSCPGACPLSAAAAAAAAEQGPPPPGTPVHDLFASAAGLRAAGPGATTGHATAESGATPENNLSWYNNYVFQPYNGFGSNYYALNYSIGLAERQFRNDPGAWNYYSSLMRSIAPGYWQTRSTLENGLQFGGIAGLDAALNSTLGRVLGPLAGIGIRAF